MHRLAEFFGTACNTFDSFTVECLGVECSFGGDNAITLLKQMVEGEDIKHVIDTGKNFRIAECNQSGAESAGRAASRNMRNISAQITLCN